MTNNPHHGTSWEDLRKQLFTPDDIAESDIRVKIIGKLIEAREAQKVSQRTLAEKAGIKQPVLARLESGTRSPQLSTILKVLRPLGFTLDIVPLTQNEQLQKTTSH